MSDSLSSPANPTRHFKRVAILFAGGPAPAANAVISAAAAAFHNSGVSVVGIKHGYSKLIDFSPANPLEQGRDYVHLNPRFLARSRNTQGIMIGTARDNPGKFVKSPLDLDDPEKCDPLRRSYEGLVSIGAEALISIGGDDTLKTANKMKLYQEKLPASEPRLPVIHLPKTIDNDYHGIDFTFGFFTAVEFLASEIRNLIYDAQSTNTYFLAETMGRSAGWLAYGAAIAGEASLVISVEDITGDFCQAETAANQNGSSRKIMNVDNVVKRIVKTMIARDNDGKRFGVIVLAEGLAEYLPDEYVAGIPRDDHGHLSISAVNLCHVFDKLVANEYRKQTGEKRKVKGVQLGYESRCAKPHAFDVMLGSQLGVGAYRALAENDYNGVMVSCTGQLQLHYEPFEKLIDPETLVTRVRLIERNSDFHKLARFLETQINE